MWHQNFQKQGHLGEFFSWLACDQPGSLSHSAGMGVPKSSKDCLRTFKFSTSPDSKFLNIPMYMHMSSTPPYFQITAIIPHLLGALWYATVSFKAVETLFVFLVSQCWCPRFHELMAINNIGGDRRQARREKTVFSGSVPTIFV